MAVSFVGSATASTTDGSDPVIDLTDIVGLAEDDVVVVIDTAANDSLVGTADVTSAGWTRAAATATGFTSGDVVVAEWKAMGASPDTSVTCAGSGVSGYGASAIALAFRGVDTTTPLDVTPTTVSGSGSNLNPPSIDPTTADCGILACGGISAAPTTLTAPTGYGDKVQEEADAASFDWITVGAWKLLSGHDAEDPGAFTGASSLWGAITIALRPAAAVVESPAVESFTATYASTNATSITGTKPTGTAAGDLIVAIHGADGNPTLTPESGFTSITGDIAPGACVGEASYKVAGASEPASYTFDCSASETQILYLLRISGADTSGPINIYGTDSSGGAIDLDAPSVTTTVDGTRVIRAAIKNAIHNDTLGFDDGNVTELSLGGTTAGTGNIQGAVAHEEQATAGATGAETYDGGNSSDDIVTFTIAIAPAGEGGGGDFQAAWARGANVVIVGTA